MTKNTYNLVDEAWIPVADKGLVSLRDVFQRTDLHALGGTALQKIAVLKLLCAVGQAAYTPDDDTAWARLTAHGLCEKVLAYLQGLHDSFWLYGEKPFLQMPAVKKAKLQEYGALMPEIASGNTSLLTQWQQSPVLNDADKALLLLVNMSLCFGGKKTDKSVVLTPGITKSSGKSGPALCHMGLLHTFLTGATLQETVWLNLQTKKGIGTNAVFTEGLGLPPWESMPAGEACPVAEKLKHSLMGRLVPLARFCLLEEDGLRYVEGIQHPDYQQGYADPSASMRETGKKTQMLWCDPTKRPWRSLSALLSFMAETNHSDALFCPLLHQGVPRLSIGGVERFGIWSGGVRVSSNAGEQYLTGADDVVESETLLDTQHLHHDNWFSNVQGFMTDLEAMSKVVYASVVSFFKAMKNGSAEDHAREATHLYWQLAEHQFQALLDACAGTELERKAVTLRMVTAAHSAFDMTCPQGTSRQIQAWAHYRPRLGKFLATH